MKTAIFGGFVALLIVITTAHAAQDLTPPLPTPPPEVLNFLQDVKKQYGPDTVALISWLIDATTHSGSVLTATVKVSGDETRDNTKFLIFQVDTGLIFNTRTTDQHGRLLILWDRILTKSFAKLDTIQVPADGVMVDLLYHSKSFPETDDIADHVDEPGPLEEAKFYFRGDQLRSFMRKEISSPELLSRTQVFVNDTPVALTLPGGARRTETLQLPVRVNESREASSLSGMNC